jgi:hypothetical protein
MQQAIILHSRDIVLWGKRKPSAVRPFGLRDRFLVKLLCGEAGVG